MNNQINSCIQILAKSYDSGQHLISPAKLFSNSTLSDLEKSSIIKFIESKQAIKQIPMVGEILPYTIEILPPILDLRSQIKSVYSFDWWVQKCKDHPIIGTIIFIVFVASLAISSIILYYNFMSASTVTQ